MTLKELEDSLKNKVTAGTLIISANDIEVQKISNFIENKMDEDYSQV